MQSYKSLSLILVVTTFISACGGTSVVPSSSTGALTANTTLNGAPLRPFDRQMLMVSGLQTLNEFIRSDVRGRVDEEAVGDSDQSYDPATIEPSQSDEAAEKPDTSNEAKPEGLEQQQQQNGYDEDTATSSASDSGKFLWAKKSFGDALKSNPVANGVIVLYADENLYDIHAMIRYIEDGRARIAERSEVPADRIQVLFGGYRGAPQVEYWLIPNGAELPEFKPEDRSKASEPEN